MSRASQGCCRYTVLRARKKSPDWWPFVRKMSNFLHGEATAAQTSCNLAMQRRRIAAGTRHNSKGNLPEKRLPAIPAGQFGKNISPHQPDEAGTRETESERANCIKGISGAERGFNIRGDETTVSRQPFNGSKTGVERRHPLARLERIAGRDHQPDLIETKHVQGTQGNLNMPFMRRIERSSEKTDPQSATVSPERDRVVVRGHDTAYGRV